MIALESCRIAKVGATPDKQKGKLLPCLLCLPRPDSLDKLLESLRYSCFFSQYFVLCSRTESTSIYCLLCPFHYPVFHNPHYKYNMSKTKESFSEYDFDSKIS